MDKSEQNMKEFERLLRESQAPLFSYIHSLLRNLNDADDLFQQVSIILWRKFSEFEHDRSFLAWACGIARLEAHNFLRVRGRNRLCFGAQLSLLLIEAQVEAEADDDSEARLEALRRCRERLRSKDQELLRLSYASDAGPAVAAEHLGRPTRSVYNSLRRIRRTLFECIQRSLASQASPEVNP